MENARNHHFADQILQRCRAENTCLVVGLDPHWDKIPADYKDRYQEDREETMTAFLTDVIDASAPFAAAFKPQVAFFERWGVAGFRALTRVLEHVRTAGVPVIMDGKRNDIGSTAQAYASAYFDGETQDFHSDALTVNAYLGYDGIKPFITNKAYGVFVLVKTSNPSGPDFQDLVLEDGRRVADQVAALVDVWNEDTIGASGFGNVGAVVGATYADVIPRFRKLMPHSLFLIPGFGWQMKGKSVDIRSAFDDHGFGALINSARDILFPRDVPWSKEAVREAARATRDRINEQR